MTTRTELYATVSPYVIERLRPDDAPAILAHLQRLAPADRSTRFGAAFDDAAVARYVDSIEFGRGCVLGARGPDGNVCSLAHVALGHGVAELGLSVEAEHRQRGLATTLAATGLREAQRLGAHEFRLHYAADNAGMRRIAQRLGMDIETEGSEVLARRRLTAVPRPTPAVAEPLAA